jgi:uncharacterized protein DUF3592
LKQLPDLAKLVNDPRVWLGAGAAIVLVAGTLLYRWKNKPPTEDEIERRRRLHVNQVGRIAEGRVIDLMKQEIPVDERRTMGVFRKSSKNGAEVSLTRQMICYSYSISGVTYETAQDVTGLEARVMPHKLIAGQPASVKYDPSNPSNSILIGDDWSGLH